MGGTVIVQLHLAVCQPRRLRTPAVVDIKGSHEQQRGADCSFRTQTLMFLLQISN